LTKLVSIAAAAVWAACVVVLSGCEIGDVRPGAKSVLEVFTPPTPEEAVRMAIDKYDPDKRYRGTLLLANAPFGGEAPYLRLFVENSQDEDPGVRAAALRGLGQHGSPADVPLIVERMKDTDPGVRTEAARALQRVHNLVAVDSLLRAIAQDKDGTPLEPEAEVRQEAANALGQYAENRVVEGLIAALADDTLAVNRATQDSLRTLTGQDFGFDRAGWQRWYRGANNLFAAQSVYVYPVFHRDRSLLERLPFVSGPPNEQASTPAGLQPGAP